MASIAPTEEPKAPSDSQPLSPDAALPGRSEQTVGSSTPWNLATAAALLALVALWARELYTTWGAWGTMSIDTGHEMYVPLLLAQGKKLYRDVWFLYGPVAPYFNSVLYRMFGAKLNVLYWAGSLSALGSAVLLFLTGTRLSFGLAGWAAGAVVLMEAFQPSLFCFPLPYAFAAVYGCLTACLFLWCAVNACLSEKRIWIFASGAAAALALLLKLEYGMACYGTLALLLASRWIVTRSWKGLARDAALTAPGLAVCAGVIGWMVSIGGVEFITQENMMSWPTAYFMKKYGKLWLELTGFTISREALLGAFQRSVPVVVVLCTLLVLISWKRSDARGRLIKALIVLGAALYLIKANFFLLAPKQSTTLLLGTVFFPRDMVLYTILGAVLACCYFLWKQAGGRRLGIVTLAVFASLLAFRILMKMRAGGYPIYYNGPVVLFFLVGLCLVARSARRPAAFKLLAETALCLACLTPVYFNTRAGEADGKRFVPLVTPRGTVRVPPHLAQSYASAIEFMKQKAALGEQVLSVPEDTGLYFFSGMYCPSRVYLFTPGVLAPGKMVKDTIEQIDSARVRYLLWSNREFPEYGAPVFGEDFDQELGGYFKSHYQPVGLLPPPPVEPKNWSAMIWERQEESGK